MLAPRAFVFSTCEFNHKGGWAGRSAPREIGTKAGKARAATREGCGGYESGAVVDARGEPTPR